MLSVFKTASEDALKNLEEEKRVRQTKHFIMLFSMGSQFDHLIVQHIAKLGIYCVVADPSTVKAADVKKAAPSGIILSGGPASVDTEPPPFDEEIFNLGIPTLGICLGFQMWASHVGARVSLAERREFGVHTFRRSEEDPLFEDIASATQVLQSHGDNIMENGPITILGSTDNTPIAAGRHEHLWGVQFHPEVTESVDGAKLYENFCVKICGITDRFPAHSIAEQKIRELQVTIGGGGTVLIALSGGSDSAVVAHLLKHAIPPDAGRLHALYIRGIDRPDDEAYVRQYFGNQNWIKLEIVDASAHFLDALRGKTSMRDKRLAMQGVYRDFLEKKIKKCKADFLAQGTLYTDLRESGHGHATGARVAEIKVHHNVGIEFSVPELRPLETEVKDSARAIGREIGVPEDLLIRHPFPGPGLVVRIEGEITKEKLQTARSVDGIFIEELRAAKLYQSVWQAGAVVTFSEHTVSKGDDAGTGHVVALWAVWSVNGFTARAAELPHEFLAHVARRMTNEIREVGSVVYRISDKPPATIEWG